MVSVDLDALRPAGAEVELVAGLLVEVGPAMAAELAADLGLPLATVGGALRMLERSGRARRGGNTWLATTPAPRRPRRSWRSGADLGA
jgi:hypothetical protein